MTKAEVGKLIDQKKFTKEMHCYQDDKLSNLIGEIFYEGVRAGYDLAKYRLELLDGGMPFDMADDFLSENMGNIREILDLCKQDEECKE